MLVYELNCAKSNIQRCLKRHNIKPFRPKFLHTLEEGDEEKRMEFCLRAQGSYLNNYHFLDNIIFMENIRHWNEENLNFIISGKRQYSQKLNVFCGVLKHRVIGPFFFHNDINRQVFLQFLSNDLWNVIEEIPLLERRDMYLQLDGAPIHNTAVVINWLNEQFPNKWIGRSSPVVRWPPRSPDLPPMDYYFWGFVKFKVYKNRPRNLEDLIDRIRQACVEITPQELNKVFINLR